ncbi:hypothetical protein V3589_10950 [Sinorhizobium fredii]|uniref:hypothetical protein n=1 Tax=Rhizobium fredii TaxID=380 RepID=UPI00309AD51C
MLPKRLEGHPLTICFRILEAMGKPGEYVWQVGKTKPGMEVRLAYLREAIRWLRIKAQEPIWRELPVDFRTFVESTQLLNKRGVLWPRVVECAMELNSGRYVEAVLTGAIGVAKTTLALYTQAYQLYVLSCLADPHRLFDMDPSSEILVIFQSVTKNLAQDVDYRRFRDMIYASPYFTTLYPFDAERESDMRFPRNVVVKPVAGHDAAALGQNVIGGIIDELNFMAVVENSKATRDSTTYDQAAQNYNAIARRRESRFMQMGTLPGMLCLVSSRNYPGQFTDKKEAEARTNPRIYVYDKRLWEIRPERFCGDKFRVFIGDETRKPRILDDDEIVALEEDRLVMAVPVEYRPTFEADLLPALRDVGGVSTQALHPFMMNTDAVAGCFGKVLSIASREDCDFRATRLQLYPRRIQHPDEPRFAHVDLALTKDSAGVSVGHVPSFVDVNRGDTIETLPLIQYDLVLEVRPPRGGEIELENIRRLLYALRDQLKLPLKWVSFDQYQSRDSMQIMSRQGFIVGYQSMDIDTFAYDVIKQAFYDDRVRAPAHPKAQKEMTTLEIDTKKNKIDHPPQGSKDVSDSMAGVALGLTMRREIWIRHKVPLTRIPPSLTQNKEQSKASLSYLDIEREARGVEVRRVV